MKKIFLFPLLIIFINTSKAQVTFKSSNEELSNVFDWAKDKALSFAHNGSDPVGYWYEAALPNREAFCMRDVSHQAIGAQILGLGRHNLNMFLKFAENINAEKDYCSYWEINRYNKPAPVDYQNDQDFWYNLPANFDVIYNAYRLYNWTGDKTYLQHRDLKKFYSLSMNEYVDHWQLGYDQILQRSRTMFADNANRFGSNRGIPTYNEGGKGETKLGIDMSASLIAALNAYTEILKKSGKHNEAIRYLAKVKNEKEFLDNFWWDKDKQTYRSIHYADDSFDYFMVDDNQAYLHYLLYYNAIDVQTKIKKIIDDYRDNYHKLIVELKSYLPIIFYENGYSAIATKMIIDLCSPENKRRDYPENSFTIIEHVARGLMGIEVDASKNGIGTISRLGKEQDWAEMIDIPLLDNHISIRHDGQRATSLTNNSGPNVFWTARIPGDHVYLKVNGIKMKSIQGMDHGTKYSSYTVEVKQGNTISVAVE